MQLFKEDHGEVVAEVPERLADFLNREKEIASASAFSRVVRKNVKYQQIALKAFKQQAGEQVTTMCRWFDPICATTAGQNQLKARPMST